MSNDSSAVTDLDEVPVAEVFRRIWHSFEASEKGRKPVLSAEECVSTCKRLIPTLDWLNSDQDKSTMPYDDYSTGELELMLLPCLMAFFEDKLPVNEASQRKDRLVRILLLYRFYLTTFRQLHLPAHPDGKPDDLDDEEEENGDSKTIHSPEYLRNKAITNFQLQRTLFARIEAQSAFEQDSDAGRRQRVLDMLRYWVYRSRREIELSEKEVKLLSIAPSASSQQPQPTKSTMPVFDINISNLRMVRDNLRQQVFGLGYPSAPSLTPQEWIVNKLATEAQHQHDHPHEPTPILRAEGQDTDSEEEEERRQDKIRTDEFKDSHRRGEGNTYRRG